ncbi:MAG: nucleotidyltransferase domain-containing protein [Nitrospiraceae bacterium]|nr:nucleotidyltransferase domain-containing protein [Nitrospiraceae bacterium]
MTTKTIRKQKKPAVQNIIREIVKRIVSQFDPEKIILFGSYARGTAGPDSDLDFLVVMPVKESKRQTQLQIRIALHDIKFPKEFEWRKNIVGTIEWPATHEGKVLYAKP